ncbi:helix-turn-helix domain-containing protein [Streptomyces violens]|uniref:helix-turn-helix domain-containing protein n=1 Tax=Streptomyces violens TaxID=66377 RepID=UPI00316AC630
MSRHSPSWRCFNGAQLATYLPDAFFTRPACRRARKAPLDMSSGKTPRYSPIRSPAISSGLGSDRSSTGSIGLSSFFACFTGLLGIRLCRTACENMLRREAAERFARGEETAAIARSLRITIRSVRRRRKAWNQDGPRPLASRGRPRCHC